MHPKTIERFIPVVVCGVVGCGWETEYWMKDRGIAMRCWKCKRSFWEWIDLRDEVYVLTFVKGVCVRLSRVEVMEVE